LSELPDDSVRDSVSKPKNNNERYFRTEHLKADLKGRSVRGGALTLSVQGCKFVLQMASTFALARLVTPEDFGLVGMVATIMGFVRIFKDLGLSKATIQRAEINHRQVSTLFWINIVFSCGIALLSIAIAPIIALIYKRPELTWIAIVLSSGFIFAGLTVQHQALLNRQMRFISLACIEIAALVSGILTGILMAWQGCPYWGIEKYWSLVAMQLAIGIITMFGVWIASGWRPGPPVRGSGIRSMLAFGGYLTGFRVLNYFTRTLDDILIGFYFGPAQLGFYNKAYKLLLLPIGQINIPITNVAIPALSRLQNEPDRYRAYYRKGMLLIVSFGMPLVAFLFVDADQAVRLLLGEQWLEAIPIFRWLAPAAFIGTFNMAAGWVYNSLGHTNRLFQWNVLASTVTAAGFIIGLRWGTTGVAAAFSITTVVLRYPSILYCFRSTFMTVGDLLGALWRPAVASIVAAAILFPAKYLKTNAVIGSNLLLDLVVYALLYTLLWCLLPNGIQTLREMLTLLKEIRPKAKKADNRHA